MRRTGTPAWLYSGLAGSAATGPLSVYLAIYVLKRGYGVVAYSIIVSQGFLATILASFVWGFLLDRGYRRSVFLTLSYGGVLACLVAMGAADNVFVVGASYVALSFFFAASAPAANLLVMQSWRRAQWSEAYGRYLFLSSLGSALGLLLGSVWTLFLPLRGLPLVFAGFSAAATALASTSIGSEAVPLDRRAALIDASSFIHRVVLNPSFYLRLPRADDFRRMAKLMKSAFTRPTPVLYMTLLVFNFGSGVFNTAFNPSLYVRGVSESLVFAVNIFVLLVQGFTMRRSGELVPEGKERSAATRGLAYRAAGYLAVAAAVALLVGAPLAAVAAASFALAGGYAFSLVYVSLNLLVFRTLPINRQGGLLGVVSALSGIGQFAGSFVSGILVEEMGYPLTESVAAALMVLALAMLRFGYNEKLAEKIVFEK